MPKKEAEVLGFFSAPGKGWGDMLSVESYMMSLVWVVGFLLLLYFPVIRQMIFPRFQGCMNQPNKVCTTLQCAIYIPQMILQYDFPKFCLSYNSGYLTPWKTIMELQNRWFMTCFPLLKGAFSVSVFVFGV